MRHKKKLLHCHSKEHMQANCIWSWLGNTFFDNQVENCKTSRKWLTVAIFRKWQDISMALWIEIALILNWRYGMVWHGL